MVDVGFIFIKSVFLSEFHNLLIVLLPIQAFVQKSIFLSRLPRCIRVKEN